MKTYNEAMERLSKELQVLEEHPDETTRRKLDSILNCLQTISLLLDDEDVGIITDHEDRMHKE